MELCRWIKTEMHWKRKALSRSSPETAEVFRPRSARKQQPSSSNGPRDSTARSWKMYILSRPWYYLAVLRTAAALATDPNKTRSWKTRCQYLLHQCLYVSTSDGSQLTVIVCRWRTAG